MDNELSQVASLRKRFQKGEITLKEFQAEKERILALHGKATSKAEPDDAKPWRRLFYILVGAPLVIFVGIIGVIMWGPKDESKSVRADLLKEQRQMEKACQEAVRDQLKAPATAEFQDVTVSAAGAGAWRVDGAVDSENSFGAQIRTSFSCDLTPSGASHSVKVQFSN